MIFKLIFSLLFFISCEENFELKKNIILKHNLKSEYSGLAPESAIVTIGFVDAQVLLAQEHESLVRGLNYSDFHRYQREVGFSAALRSDDKVDFFEEEIQEFCLSSSEGKAHFEVVTFSEERLQGGVYFNTSSSFHYGLFNQKIYPHPQFIQIILESIENVHISLEVPFNELLEMDDNEQFSALMSGRLRFLYCEDIVLPSLTKVNSRDESFTVRSHTCLSLPIANRGNLRSDLYADLAQERWNYFRENHPRKDNLSQQMEKFDFFFGLIKEGRIVQSPVPIQWVRSESNAEQASFRIVFRQ